MQKNYTIEETLKKNDTAVLIDGKLYNQSILKANKAIKYFKQKNINIKFFGDLNDFEHFSGFWYKIEKNNLFLERNEIIAWYEKSLKKGEVVEVP